MPEGFVRLLFRQLDELKIGIGSTKMEQFGLTNGSELVGRKAIVVLGSREGLRGPCRGLQFIGGESASEDS